MNLDLTGKPLITASSPGIGAGIATTTQSRENRW